LIKSVSIKPARDGSETVVQIVTATRSDTPSQLARLLMLDVSIEIVEAQLPLPTGDGATE
jgi:hypothetical protein